MCHSVVGRRRTYIIGVCLFALAVTVSLLLRVVRDVYLGAERDRGVEVIPSEVVFVHDPDNPRSEVVVEIHNRNIQPVTIMGVQSSCGCTVPKFEPGSVIRAGDKVTVPITVSPPGYGRRDSVIKIHTDSKRSAEIEVPIHLFGRKMSPPVMSYAPNRILVEFANTQKKVSASFQVVCVESDGPAWLQGFKSSFGGLVVRSCNMTKELEIDKGELLRTYQADIDVDMSSGQMDASSVWITPTTRTEATAPHPRIELRLSPVAPIRAVPSSAVISFASQDLEAVSRQIVLIAADDEKWEVTAVDTDQAWLTGQAVPQASSGRTRRIMLAGKKPSFDHAAVQQSDVRILTSHPKCPEVVVRITAVQASKPTGMP